MTPFEIDVLMHYHCHADDHKCVISPPPIWRTTIDRFIEEDLIELVPEAERTRGHLTSFTSFQTYRLTERGHAYCESLKRVPLPELRREWVTCYPARTEQVG
jgi:hypothetical protein